MIPTAMMFASVDWYRPPAGKDAANAQTLGTGALQLASVPACVQPMSAPEKELYGIRADETAHTVYTTSIQSFARNDYLLYGTRRLKVIGTRNLIELGRVIALDCLEFTTADLRG